MEAALKVIRRQGILDKHDKLTPLGRVLHRTPVEVGISKLLIYGALFRCFDPALTLATIATNRRTFVPPLHVQERVLNETTTPWPSVVASSDQLVALEAYTSIPAVGQKSAAKTDPLLADRSLLEFQRIRDFFRDYLRRTGAVDLIGGQDKDGNGNAGMDEVDIPSTLNDHADQLPLLAGLITLSCAPHVFVRTAGVLGRTEIDNVGSEHA